MAGQNRNPLELLLQRRLGRSWKLVWPSLIRANRDWFRLQISLAFFVVFGFVNAFLSGRIVFSLTLSFLFGAAINYLSVIPWRVKLRRGPTTRLFLFTANAALALALGALWFLLALAGASLLSDGIESTLKALPYFVPYTVHGLFYVIAGFGIALGEQQERVSCIEAARARRMERLAEQARLIALRAQMNPHFFFNALNTISALIPERPKDAERAVELLAESLRPILMRDQPATASLEQEIRTARAYAEIEQLRFGDRIAFSWNANDALLCQMPSLSLQPLIENAVRHGVAYSVAPHRIEVVAVCGDGNLVVTIRNAPSSVFNGVSWEALSTVALVPQHAVHNIEQRAKGLFGAAARLDLRADGAGCGIAVLVIPKSPPTS